MQVRALFIKMFPHTLSLNCNEVVQDCDVYKIYMHGSLFMFASVPENFMYFLNVFSTCHFCASV